MTTTEKRVFTGIIVSRCSNEGVIVPLRMLAVKPEHNKGLAYDITKFESWLRNGLAEASCEASHGCQELAKASG